MPLLRQPSDTLLNCTQDIAALQETQRDFDIVVENAIPGEVAYFIPYCMMGGPDALSCVHLLF